MIKKLKRKFVEYIYADHNHSKSVKENLHALLEQIEPGQVGLNVGAGYSRLHPQIKNLDIQDGPNIDYVGSAERLPFENTSFDLIITQETLEHVSDPFLAMGEISRILKPGGKLYCQLPFIIGFHPGPNDYWRFSEQGIKELIKRSGLKILNSGITVGGEGIIACRWNFGAFCSALEGRLSTKHLKQYLLSCCTRSNGWTFCLITPLKKIEFQAVIL